MKQKLKIARKKNQSVFFRKEPILSFYCIIVSKMSGIIVFQAGPGELKRSFAIGTKLVDSRLVHRWTQEQAELIDHTGSKPNRRIGPELVFRDDHHNILYLEPEIEAKIYPADQIKLDPHRVLYIQVDPLRVYLTYLEEKGYRGMVEKYRQKYGLER